MPLAYVTFNWQRKRFDRPAAIMVQKKTQIVPELSTNDSDNQSIGRSNATFGGDIRRFFFLPSPNENEPQRPPCGRQIAALLARLPVRDSDAVLSF